MKKCYEEFVEELRQELIFATGFKEDQIYLKRKDEYPPTSSDRIFIECARRENAREVCALYCTDLYEYYLEDVPVRKMVEDSLNDLKRMKDSGILECALYLSDYEKVKKNLFIRLLNAEKNKHDLESAVYRQIGDIAMVLYMKMGEFDDCITSMKIKKDTVEKWDLDEQDVFDAALKNTYLMTPPRVYFWERLLLNSVYEGENFMDILSKTHFRKDAVGNCLSTTKRTNGAVAIFLPGVAARVAELIGNSFYMVFTSVHEVMIHNAKLADAENLREILKDTVQAATPEDDFLSYYIYHYDKDSGLITFE